MTTTTGTANENDTLKTEGEEIEVDTSDWLTYTNEEYGFSFKYPSNWSIKQNWLEQGSQGNKYNVYLQNQNSDSILFFLTTANFTPEEGEGEQTYVTGLPIENNADVEKNLKKRGLPIYQSANIDKQLDNIYYITPSYGGTKLSLLSIFQNQTKQFTFLTINSPLLADWPDTISASEIDKTIGQFESANLQNHTVIDEYLGIIKTVQY